MVLSCVYFVGDCVMEYDMLNNTLTLDFQKYKELVANNKIKEEEIDSSEFVPSYDVYKLPKMVVKFKAMPSVELLEEIYKIYA